MVMIIIVSVGLPGSGKSLVSDVAQSMGIRTVSMGDAVRRYYGHSDKKETIGEFADSERQRYGKAVWAERTMEGVDDDIILVDGCRSPDELDVLRSYGRVIVISVRALSQNRYDRLVSRSRDDSPRSMAEFDVRDRREMEYGVESLMDMSDFVITTTELQNRHWPRRRG